MPKQGEAFLKGGIGCLLAFGGMAACAVLVGGTAHIDIGGAVILLVIGGVIGLIINAIYQKGRKDGGDRDPNEPPGEN